MTQQRKYSPYKVGTVSITCNSSLVYLGANKKTLLPLLTLFTLFKQLQSKKAVMPRYTEYGYIALWVGAGVNTPRLLGLLEPLRC